MKVIAKINSSVYGGLTKILTFLAKDKESIDSLSIHKGEIFDMTNTGFIYADIKDLFGENSIEFLDPKYSVKLMRLLKGGDEFVFIDDEDNSRYSITNITSSVSIPKSNKGVTSLKMPTFDTVVSTLDIETDIVANIDDAKKTLESEKVIIELNDTNSKIIGVNIDDNYEYRFDVDYKDDINKFSVFNIMPIKGEGYKYQLLKSSANDELWLRVIVDLTLLEVQYFEKLVPLKSFDAFSLV